MLLASDSKRGYRVELEDEPFVIVDISTQNPTARGANTLIKLKLRNLRTGQLLDRTFKSSERLKQPDFEFRDVEFLYAEGDGPYHFMDAQTYEQFPLGADSLTDAIPYLRPNDTVRAMMFNGTCIGVEMPHTVELEVTETEPGARGDTVTSAQKSARLETGLEVQVPLFVNTGDRIVVDTRDGRYLRRA